MADDKDMDAQGESEQGGKGGPASATIGTDGSGMDETATGETGGQGVGEDPESGGGYGNHATGGQDGEREGGKGAAPASDFGLGNDQR